MEEISGGFGAGMFASRAELLVLYGVGRKFKAGLADNNVEFPNEKSAAYFNWLDAGQSSKALREWTRDQTIVDLQHPQLDRNFVLDNSKLSGGLNENPASHLSVVRSAIRGAVEGASEIDYDGRRKDIVVRFADGRMLEFAGMSDGQRTLIGMIADIARRACILKGDELGSDVLAQTTGLVLIDELDLHLHPKWQRRVIADLKRIFPKIQFFATTHSPQIIGEARPEEIVLLTPQGLQKPRPSQSFGMDSNWVLECVMEADGRDPLVAKEIKALFDEIEAGKFDEAHARIEKLRADIGDMPDLVGAESYIWRVEHEGDEAAE